MGSLFQSVYANTTSSSAAAAAAAGVPSACCVGLHDIIEAVC
jgi:hypothetical protein